MLTEYEERVIDYWSFGERNCIVKLAQDERKDNDNDKINVMPLHLGAFVLSNSNRIMNNFAEAIGGFETNDVYYGDTDSIYNENEHWKKLDELCLVGKNMLQGKRL